MVLRDQPLNHLASIQFYTALTAQISSRWGNGVVVPFLHPVLPTVETHSAHTAGTGDWLCRIATCTSHGLLSN